MRKPKFVDGDRVVLVGNKHGDDSPKFKSCMNLVGTVDEWDDVPWVIFDNGTREVCDQDDLEYEVIYNSPLYKALR